MKFGSLRSAGEVKPGFESVQKLFERNMSMLAEEKAQLCVYVGDEMVVDLWAAPVDDSEFGPDSLINVFSSGKSLEAIAIAWLVSGGYLDYSSTIASLWPEFAVNGKEELTVAELMRHEGGMAAFDTSLAPEDLSTENIRNNRVGAVIEQQSLKYRDVDDGRREYHALTRGWIANEVFRRAHPEGRTIGEFLRTELDADVHIGVSGAERRRTAPVKQIGFGYHVKQSLRPASIRGVEHSFVELGRRVANVVPSIRKGTRRGAPPPFAGLDAVDAFNLAEVAAGETPSANAHCSARGLAKTAAMMANGGVWENRSFLSREAWQAAHAAPEFRKMGSLPTTFTQGGLATFNSPGPDASPMERAFNRGREGFFGWMGLGGSLFQWHPERRIGFAFVPTALHTLDFMNERGKRYQAEVLRVTG